MSRVSVELPNRFLCSTLVGVALTAATFAFSSVAEAHPTGTSVAINFGASEPSGARSDVEGEAGVLGTVNWNNLDDPSGGGDFDPVFVKADERGEAIDSDVTVEWNSNNTWSSTGRGNEENNTAPPGDDRNLMTGYLDTNANDPAVVTIGEMDAITDEPFTVYVYINGGVRGRGGDYVIEDDNGMSEPIAVVDTEFFDGTYVEGENYIVFEEVEGLSFPLMATPTTGATRRAPINAIEIVVASTAPTGANLLPSDINGDGSRNISDPVALLGYLFTSNDVLPSCYKVPDSNPVELSEQGKKVADFNGDGNVNLTDPVADLSHQFAGDPNPPHVLGTACIPIAPGACADLCNQ